MRTLQRATLIGLAFLFGTQGAISAQALASENRMQRVTTISGFVKEKYPGGFDLKEGRHVIRVILSAQTDITDRSGNRLRPSSIRVRDKVIVRGWDTRNKRAFRALHVRDLSRAGHTLSSSGITGSVLVGPACPAQGIRWDPRCEDQPYQGTIVVWNEAKTRYITQFSSDKNGNFKIYLPPGTYVLDPQTPSGSRYPRGIEQTITIAPREMKSLTIYYDSGIRY